MPASSFLCIQTLMSISLSMQHPVSEDTGYIYLHSLVFDSTIATIIGGVLFRNNCGAVGPLVGGVCYIIFSPCGLMSLAEETTTQLMWLTHSRLYLISGDGLLLPHPAVGSESELPWEEIYYLYSPISAGRRGQSLDTNYRSCAYSVIT